MNHWVASTRKSIVTLDPGETSLNQHISQHGKLQRFFRQKSRKIGGLLVATVEPLRPREDVSATLFSPEFNRRGQREERHVHPHCPTGAGKHPLSRLWNLKWKTCTSSVLCLLLWQRYLLKAAWTLARCHWTPKQDRITPWAYSCLDDSNCLARIFSFPGKDLVKFQPGYYLLYQLAHGQTHCLPLLF